MTRPTLEPEFTYFEVQALVGTTKHMGGLESTKALIGLCPIDRDSIVLDVGCGAGATPVYLVRNFGCRVVAVDLRQGMIDRTLERVTAEGVQHRVECQVADAQDLPFEDGRFDAVLCESVATFVQDKQRVVDELARVTKPGGTVCLNEEVWLKPAPLHVQEWVAGTWDIFHEIVTAEEWQAMMGRAGLHDLFVEVHALDTRTEASQVKRYRARDMWRMFTQTISLYVRYRGFREYMRGRGKLPKGTFEYLGYGLFAGRR